MHPLKHFMSYKALTQALHECFSYIKSLEGCYVCWNSRTFTKWPRIPWPARIVSHMRRRIHIIWGGWYILLQGYLGQRFLPGFDLFQFFIDEIELAIDRFYFNLLHLCVCLCACMCVGVCGWVGGCMCVCVCARANTYIPVAFSRTSRACCLQPLICILTHKHTCTHTEREREREREGERRRERERGEQLGSLQVVDSPYCVDQTNRLYIAKTLNLARRLFKFNVTVL